MDPAVQKTLKENLEKSMHSAMPETHTDLAAKGGTPVSPAMAIPPWKVTQGKASTTEGFDVSCRQGSAAYGAASSLAEARPHPYQHMMPHIGMPAATQGPVRTSSNTGFRKRYLKPLPDGRRPSDAEVMCYAETASGAGGPLVTDRAGQVTDKTLVDKSTGHEKPHAIIIKPKFGRGNVSIFSKTGLVPIQASDKTGMKSKLVGMIQHWTVEHEPMYS